VSHCNAGAGKEGLGKTEHMQRCSATGLPQNRSRTRVGPKIIDVQDGRCTPLLQPLGQLLLLACQVPMVITQLLLLPLHNDPLRQSAPQRANC